MKRHGPDSLNSWLVVACLTFVSMILYSVVRLSGVLFVASMDRFGVDRKSASLPYILTDFIQAVSSPLTGFLASKFGARLVMVFGCLVSAIGIASCFFAQTIGAVTIFWGVVFGVGFGLSVPLLALVVTQHFVEKRAIAIGIVYFGGYVGYSALPTIVEHMIEHYGLSGTFLLVAGFMLNCIPVALLLRKPKYLTKKTVSESDVDVVWSRDYDGSGGVDNSGFELESNNKNLEVTKRSGYVGTVENADDCKGVTKHCMERNRNVMIEHSPTMESNVEYDVVWTRDSNNDTNGSVRFDYRSFELESKNLKVTSRSGYVDRVKDAEDCKGVTNHCMELDRNMKSDNLSVTKRYESNNSRNERHSKNIKKHYDVSTSPKFNRNPLNSTSEKKNSNLRAFKVFLEPVYIVMLIAEAVFEGSFIAFVTIIVDFSLDVGLASSDTKFVILAFSIASNVGLVSFGWVTDDGHLSLTTFSGLLLVLRCATSAFIPFSKSMPVLLTAVALHGLCEAPLSNLFPLIIAEYYSPEAHGVAISCRLFLCAPVYLVTPTLIGYFRDGMGSYFYLFQLISLFSLVSGVLCYFIPQLSKWRCGRGDSSSILKQRT